MKLRELQQQLRRFAEERNWERFHSPKNLSMALSVEAAELLEHFQWLTEEQSASLGSPERDDVAAEIADIQIYLAMLADKLGIDIENAISAKLESNAAKYPAATSRPS
jgi:dCTP diphosphatase